MLFVDNSEMVAFQSRGNKVYKLYARRAIPHQPLGKLFKQPRSDFAFKLSFLGGWSVSNLLCFKK